MSVNGIVAARRLASAPACTHMIVLIPCVCTRCCFFLCVNELRKKAASQRMLAGGADDVLKSHKMKEKNDKSVMTKAE